MRLKDICNETAGERMRVTVCKACERECEGVREKKKQQGEEGYERPSEGR